MESQNAGHNAIPMRIVMETLILDLKRNSQSPNNQRRRRRRGRRRLRRSTAQGSAVQYTVIHGAVLYCTAALTVQYDHDVVLLAVVDDSTVQRSAVTHPSYSTVQ